MLPSESTISERYSSPNARAYSTRGHFARDEMNLSEFPLAVLSSRTNPDVKTLEFSDFQRLKNGELVERKWIITGADKFGLPTSTDDDVILGLICLTMDQGFREQKVYFTRYELLKILRWSTEGRSYSRLTKSLDRLSGVRIRASNAFYDNASKAYQTKNFGVIDGYEINDERAAAQHSKSGLSSKSFFIWSEVLFDSFKSGFIKKLDLDIYFNLKSAVSRRLYRYLDKHFYYRNTIERQLMFLAFEKLGLSRSYKYASSVKQQLEPAVSELIECGFLANCEYLGKGEETVVRFTHGSGGGTKKTAVVLENNSSKPVSSRTQHATRPEHITVSRNKNPLDSADPEHSGNNALYQSFVQDRIAQIRGKIGEEKYREILAHVENKLECLRGVLDPNRFTEAVSGCFKDELRKRYGIPTLEEWKRNI
jgi:plasmid replication initiation protein